MHYKESKTSSRLSYPVEGRLVSLCVCLFAHSVWGRDVCLSRSPAYVSVINQAGQKSSNKTVVCSSFLGHVSVRTGC